MKRIFLGLALAAAAMSMPASASADVTAYTTADVNMRTGPSTRYPVILAIPRGQPVVIYQCLSYRSWCSVGWRWHRGWVSSRYLSRVGAYRPYYRPRYVQPPVYVYPPSIYFDFDIFRDRPHRRPPTYRRHDRRRDFHRPPRKRIERRRERREPSGALSRKRIPLTR